MTPRLCTHCQRRPVRGRPHVAKYCSNQCQGRAREARRGVRFGGRDLTAAQIDALFERARLLQRGRRAA